MKDDLSFIPYGQNRTRENQRFDFQKSARTKHGDTVNFRRKAVQKTQEFMRDQINAVYDEKRYSDKDKVRVMTGFAAVLLLTLFLFYWFAG